MPTSDPAELTEPSTDEIDDRDHPTNTDTAPSATVVPFPTVNDDDGDGNVSAASGDVDELFARLRPDEVEPATDVPGPPPEADAPEITDGADVAHEADDVDVPETPFQRRDAVLVPLIVASARKLKRVLADEQNEVLDALRRREPVRSLDDLVPAAAEQSTRYVDTIAAELMLAAEAGSAAVEGTVALEVGPTGTLAPVRESLASGLVVPFRERLERCLDEGDGDNDAVTKRPPRGLPGVEDAAHRRAPRRRFPPRLWAGCVRRTRARPAVSWIVDPDGPACPDAEDNSLAGVVELGQGPSPPATAALRRRTRGAAA